MNIQDTARELKKFAGFVTAFQNLEEVVESAVAAERKLKSMEGSEKTLKASIDELEQKEVRIRESVMQAQRNSQDKVREINEKANAEISSIKQGVRDERTKANRRMKEIEEKLAEVNASLEQAKKEHYEAMGEMNREIEAARAEIGKLKGTAQALAAKLGG